MSGIQKYLVAYTVLKGIRFIAGWINKKQKLKSQRNKIIKRSPS